MKRREIVPDETSDEPCHASQEYAQSVCKTPIFFAIDMCWARLLISAKVTLSLTVALFGPESYFAAYSSNEFHALSFVDSEQGRYTM